MDKKLHKPPAFQFYCNDWLSSPTVMLLEPLQELAFFRILLFMWQDDDCGIDPDPEKWGRLTRTDANTCSIVFEMCLTPHPTCSNKLTSQRLYDYALAQTEYHAKKQAAGRKSGEARRNRKLSRENTTNTAASEVGTPVQSCSNKREHLFNSVRTNANPSSSPSGEEDARAPDIAEGDHLNSNAGGITERGDIVVPSSLTKRAVSAVWSWIDYTNRPDTEARGVLPDSPQAEALFALAARWKLSDDDIEQHVDTAIAGNWLKLNTPRQGEYRSGATTEEHAGRF